jgi:hypothetical protein
VNSSSDGTGTGGNIKLSVTDGTGEIDTTNGSLTSYSAGGNGGAIELSTVGGNIRTNNVNSFSADGDGGNIKLSVTGGTGAIDTTNGSVNSYSTGGNGGAIELSTFSGNIITKDLVSYSKGTGTAGNINLSVTGGTGAINTSIGSISSISNTGNGGAIALSTVDGNITTGVLESGSYSTGTGGNVTLNSGTENTILSGNIDTSSATGIGGQITFESPVVLSQPTITLTTSGTTSSGNVAFNKNLDGTTANNESLLVNAGAGNITFNGAVGNTNALGNITANSTGITAFNQTVNAASLTTDMVAQINSMTMSLQPAAKPTEMQ